MLRMRFMRAFTSNTKWRHMSMCITYGERKHSAMQKAAHTVETNEIVERSNVNVRVRFNAT
jgi:hypothetical protein